MSFKCITRVALAFCPMIILSTAVQAARQEAAFKPTATLQEIMTAIIDPNIDYVWNSVSSVSTAQGTEERRPVSDDDWKAVRQHALAVAEAGNLLLIKGRPVAAHGATTSSGGAELNPADIQKAIEKNRTAFNQGAAGLRDTVQQVLDAVDHKNAEELVEAGGRVERACEQCHSKFWYPGDKRPK
jgi:hypothetical protein